MITFRFGLLLLLLAVAVDGSILPRPTIVGVPEVDIATVDAFM